MRQAIAGMDLPISNIWSLEQHAYSILWWKGVLAIPDLDIGGMPRDRSWSFEATAEAGAFAATIYHSSSFNSDRFAEAKNANLLQNVPH